MCRVSASIWLLHALLLACAVHSEPQAPSASPAVVPQLHWHYPPFSGKAEIFKQQFAYNDLIILSWSSNYDQVGDRTPLLVLWGPNPFDLKANIPVNWWQARVPATGTYNFSMATANINFPFHPEAFPGPFHFAIYWYYERVKDGTYARPARGKFTVFHLSYEKAPARTFGAQVTHLPCSNWPSCDDQSSDESGGLSGGAIAGIVLGVVAALILVGALVFLWRRERRKLVQTEEQLKVVSELANTTVPAMKAINEGNPIEMDASKASIAREMDAGAQVPEMPVRDYSGDLITKEKAGYLPSPADVSAISAPIHEKSSDHDELSAQPAQTVPHEQAVSPMETRGATVHVSSPSKASTASTLT